MFVRIICAYIYVLGHPVCALLLQAHRNSSDNELYTLDDVDAAFDRVVQLKYSQHVELEGETMPCYWDG